MNKLIKLIETVINDLMNKPQIQITAVESDERSNKKHQQTYNVNYQKNVDGDIIEIEGTLNPYQTGRNTEYRFEVRYFSDELAETYWNENWENIDEEIQDKFYQSL
jgi:hypothetical protein